MASIFGVHAMELIEQERFGRMVAWRDRQVVDVPIAEAVAAPALVDVNGPVVRTARRLGICLGDE
jgi:6-phosphofructokinase 1